MQDLDKEIAFKVSVGSVVLLQQCSRGTFWDLFGDPGSKRTLRNNAPGVPFRTFSETLDPSGPCATMLQGYLFGPFRRHWIQTDLAQQCSRGAFSDLFGDPGSKRTLRNNAPAVPFRTFSETLDPSGPCATMLQGCLFGPGSKRTLHNNAPGVLFRTFLETLDASGPCATMLQGTFSDLFGPFRRPWIQADLTPQCSRGTFSDLFGDPGSKRTLRNNAPGVPFRTFSETLDPSGPCATMLQGYLFGPFRRPWIQADLAQQCSRGTFSDLFGDRGSKRTLRNNAPGTSKGPTLSPGQFADQVKGPPL